MTGLLASPVLSVLLALEREGVTFRRGPDGRVQYRPVAKVSSEARAALTAHDVEARALVALCTDPVLTDTITRFLAIRDAYEGDGLPALLVVPDLALRSGFCVSCDATISSTVGRCWRCVVAWRLVSGLEIPLDVIPVDVAA